MSRNMTKLTEWHVRPVKTQISLDIHPVWSVFAVCTKKHWVLSRATEILKSKLVCSTDDVKDPLAIHYAHSEDSDQSVQMTRLI